MSATMPCASTLAVEGVMALCRDDDNPSLTRVISDRDIGAALEEGSRNKSGAAK